MAGKRRQSVWQSKRESTSWIALVASVAVGASVYAVLLTFATSVHAQSRKKITLDDLVIEGNIQKPEAFFILPRTNLNFADLERREDLKSRIIQSVEKEPF